MECCPCLKRVAALRRRNIGKRWVNAIEHSARISSSGRQAQRTAWSRINSVGNVTVTGTPLPGVCLHHTRPHISYDTSFQLSVCTRLIQGPKNLLVHPSVRNSKVSAQCIRIYIITRFVGGAQDSQTKGVHTRYEYKNICV